MREVTAERRALVAIEIEIVNDDVEVFHWTPVGHRLQLGELECCFVGLCGHAVDQVSGWNSEVALGSDVLGEPYRDGLLLLPVEVSNHEYKNWHHLLLHVIIKGLLLNFLILVLVKLVSFFVLILLKVGVGLLFRCLAAHVSCCNVELHIFINIESVTELWFAKSMIVLISKTILVFHHIFASLFSIGLCHKGRWFSLGRWRVLAALVFDVRIFDPNVITIVIIL